MIPFPRLQRARQNHLGRSVPDAASQVRAAVDPGQKIACPHAWNSLNLAWAACRPLVQGEGLQGPIGLARLKRCHDKYACFLWHVVTDASEVAALARILLFSWIPTSRAGAWGAWRKAVILCEALAQLDLTPISLGCSKYRGPIMAQVLLARRQPWPKVSSGPPHLSSQEGTAQEGLVRSGSQGVEPDDSSAVTTPCRFWSLPEFAAHQSLLFSLAFFLLDIPISTPSIPDPPKTNLSD